MSRFQLHGVVLLATGFLSGCASSQMNRIDSNREIYESWPIEIRQAVLDGKVEPGMTPDMVIVAWGKPTERVAQSNSGDEIWVYKKGGSEPSVIYPNGSVGGMGGGMGTIGTGTRGGVNVGTAGGIGMGGGMGGTVIGPTGGLGGPVILPGSPPEIREVVFRNGVVQRADTP
jgi:hypothetical protein